MVLVVFVAHRERERNESFRIANTPRRSGRSNFPGIQRRSSLRGITSTTGLVPRKPLPSRARAQLESAESGIFSYRWQSPYA